MPKYVLRVIQTYTNVRFFGDTSLKVVALSIDDGPSSDHTINLGILNVLNEYDSKATFFLIGSHVLNYDQEQRYLRHLIESGNEIGNHGMIDRAAIQLEANHLMMDIEETENILESGNHKISKFFRPGSGFLTFDQMQSVQRSGRDIILGSVYPHDCIFTNPEKNANYILNKIEPGDIIILHQKEYTIKTLQIILSELKRRGYKVTTVGRLLENR